MSITAALESICLHRDLVPIYYDRRTGNFIVTGVYRTRAGAVLVDQDGTVLRMYPSKRDAIDAITTI